MVDAFIFFVLLVASGFFSSAETAFFSLSPAQARMVDAQRGSWFSKLVLRLKSAPEELLTTILIGNNIVNILTASYATVVAARFFGSAAMGVATGATTLFILIFGEIVPKSLAYSNNARIALFAAPVLFALRTILYPLVRLLTAFSTMLQRSLGSGSSAGVTEDEVRMMARLSVEHGEMAYREREMIENVFRFDDITVREIMTPRYRVIALNGMVPVEQIAYFVGQDAHSRYPVYVGDEDDIIGYIHVNTLLRILKSDERHRLVKEFVSAIPRVPESRKIERIFRAMKRDAVHMYLVHRDSAPEEIVGLVTLENVLEEIVGEIEDETDDVESAIGEKAERK